MPNRSAPGDGITSGRHRPRTRSATLRRLARPLVFVTGTLTITQILTACGPGSTTSAPPPATATPPSATATHTTTRPSATATRTAARPSATATHATTRPSATATHSTTPPRHPTQPPKAPPTQAPVATATRISAAPPTATQISAAAPTATATPNKVTITTPGAGGTTAKPPTRVTAPTIAPTHVSAPAPAPTSPPTRVAPPTPTSAPVPAKPATVTPAPAKPATATPPHTVLAAAYPSYEVGAYYFSGWSHGQNDNISSLLTGRYKDAEPLIGWYDDSQAAVDKSIDQAANAGIDFFAFDWYDTSYSPYPTDRTLNEGLKYYLTSSQRHRLKFSIVFVDHAPFVPTPDHPQAIASWRTKEWPKIIDQWIPLFKQPDYVRVDGKPLLTIFAPDHLEEISGGPANVPSVLDELRRRVRAAGLPGVTIAIAATVAPHSNPIKVQELNAEGFDAATGYNYHSMGNEQYRVPVPYSQLIAENEGVWNRVAADVHVPYIPVITSGWDQRYDAREQSTAIIYGGRTAAQFACYAVDARHWIDTHPSQTTKERIVMIYAWNEIGEGGAIIPNHQYGYAYTNVVHNVFGSASSAPQTPPGCK